jgi:hypothetical protein
MHVRPSGRNNTVRHTRFNYQGLPHSESDCKHNPSPSFDQNFATHRMQISATGWGGIIGVTLIVALMLYVMV